MQYVTSSGGDAGCIFCASLESDSEADAGILYRDETVFAILNAFPYNTGHLMIAPRVHIGELGELGPNVRADLMELVARSVEIVTEAMSPGGFNVGMNLGHVAGAGVPGHLHVHVVPRWGGDTNFMTTVGDTKVLPEMLSETYAKLRPGFESPTAAG